MVGFELFVPVEEGLMGRLFMGRLALGAGRRAEGRGGERRHYGEGMFLGRRSEKRR